MCACVHICMNKRARVCVCASVCTLEKRERERREIKEKE